MKKVRYVFVIGSFSICSLTEGLKSSVNEQIENASTLINLKD